MIPYVYKIVRKILRHALQYRKVSLENDGLIGM